MAVAIIN